MQQQQGKNQKARRPSVDKEIERAYDIYGSNVDKNKLQDLYQKFAKYDQGGKSISKYEINNVISEMGVKLSDERAKKTLDEYIMKKDIKRTADFGQVLDIYGEIMKAIDEDESGDLEYKDAFLFLAGDSDVVSKSRIIEVLKNDFDMDIDIEEILEQMLEGDPKQSLTFNEFVLLFEQHIEDNKSRASFISHLSQKAQSTTKTRSNSFSVKYRDFEKWLEQQDKN